KGVVRVELDGAHAGCEDAIQLFVVALKARTILPRVELLAHRELLERNVAHNPVYQDIGVAEAVRVEHLEAIVLAPRDEARPSWRAEHAGRAGDRLYHIREIEERAGRRVKRKLHQARDDAAHIENQACRSAGWDIDSER